MSHSGSDDVALEQAMQPGEFAHYHTNLLTLFGAERGADAVERLATEAVAFRESAMRGFAARLEDWRGRFDAAEAAGSATQAPPMQLQGFDVARLETLRDQHGGLLVALFHQDEHRHVFADLVCHGLPFVAPVAKRAYFETKALCERGPQAMGDAPMFVEVEGEQVGKSLLVALKRGRIGLIYVDGNMGPDGHRVDQGGCEVEFIGKRIRVKAGIARLSLALGLPILPIHVVPAASADGAAVATVEFGELIVPADRALLRAMSESAQDAYITGIMQSLYRELADVVRRHPSRWEFAFCLHRWLADEASPAAETGSDVVALGAEDPLRIDAGRVTEFRRGAELYWIDVARQRAVRMPDFASSLYRQLRAGEVRAARLVDSMTDAGAPAPQAWALLVELHERRLIAAA